MNRNLKIQIQETFLCVIFIPIMSQTNITKIIFLIPEKNQEMSKIKMLEIG